MSEYWDEDIIQEEPEFCSEDEIEERVLVGVTIPFFSFLEVGRAGELDGVTWSTLRADNSRSLRESTVFPMWERFSK